MGQTGSAQREPSMEEILASIRRIIEDSDTTRPPVEEDAARSEPAAAVEAGDGGQGEVEAFRAELEAAAAPVSMSEIHASVTQARGHEPEEDAEPAQSAEIRPIRIEPPMQAEAAEVEPASEAPAEPEPEPVEAPDSFHSRPEEPVETAPALVAPEPEPEPAASEPEPAMTVPEPVTAAEAGKAAIISDSTGRQVAAAFGELSEAFAASRRRSFDQMAEEMLRPMLQDWLDNNLPTLVERLVREEIERVARGGQG